MNTVQTIVAMIWGAVGYAALQYLTHRRPKK